MNEPELTVKCEIFCARLTELGCQNNRKVARHALDKIRNGGPLLAFELDRLAGCCHCPRSLDLPRDEYEKYLTRKVEEMADMSLGMRETDRDKIRAKERALWRKWYWIKKENRKTPKY